MRGKISPVILTILGVIGLGATTYFAIHDTCKAKDILYEKEKELEKDEELTFKQKVKLVGKCYIPTLSCFLGTAGCFTAGCIISKKAEVSLIAINEGLNELANRRKGIIRELFGEDAESKIQESLCQKEYEENGIPKQEAGMELYYEEHLKFFQANPLKFAYALSIANERLNECNLDRQYYWYITFKEILDLAEAKYDEKNPFLNYGFSMEYLDGRYDLTWVHAVTEHKVIDDKYCTSVEFIEDPVPAPDESWFDEMKSKEIIPEGDENE